MYRTCLHCTADLGKNDALETLPIGRQIAFDSKQGRLWVVCSSCAKWNLVPFDGRLETIDSCERMFRVSKTRYSTDHIGLAKLSEGLSLIRIGAPEGQEFASWRYGRGFRSRRLRARLITGGITVPAVALFATPVVGNGIAGLMLAIPILASAISVGSHTGVRFAEKQMLRLNVRRFGGGMVRLNARDLKRATIIASEQVRLHIDDKNWELNLNKHETDQLAGRILGKLNSMHGTDDELREAVDVTSQMASGPDTGSLTELIAKRQITGKGGRGTLRLADIVPHQRLAYEMWDNEESERVFLSGQLQLLERQWREAEELAKLSDGLALPEGTDDALTRLKAQK